MRHIACIRPVTTILLSAALAVLSAAGISVEGGPIPGPLPLFPGRQLVERSTSRTRRSIPARPDTSASSTTAAHGRCIPISVGTYRPAAFRSTDSRTSSSTAPCRFVPCISPTPTESDGVNHSTGASFPFYPIPDEAITQAHWIESGEPGNVDLRASSDRHILIFERDHRRLFELYNVYFDGASWNAGSGAFFDVNANGRRPDGWTSADAAGLAILPGLVRYDEVFGTGEINHALRVTVRSTNGYVYPASHSAGSRAGALPMGARLRMKAGRDISAYRAGDSEDLPRDEALWTDRGRQRVGYVCQRCVRHAVGQRGAEPRVSLDDGQRLRSGPAWLQAGGGASTAGADEPAHRAVIARASHHLRRPVSAGSPCGGPREPRR